MNLETMPLVNQLEMVMRTLSNELRYLDSGTVFVQIRNDVVGKFGVKHEPIDMKVEGTLPKTEVYMDDENLKSFRQLVIGSLDHKKNWTHGEIYYEFSMKKNALHANVQFETNYNMANLLGKPNSNKG
ncbi:O-methyltransferase [Gorillibacterium sp. sgz5001074]|uniref:O-methyltransferase n=1 Tax=Gorillibacterium sp. sgz5001074 TaxID=3446695 RepID=UPI003F673342